MMKPSVKLILLSLLVLCGESFAKAHEQDEVSDSESDVESDSTDVDEQNGNVQSADGNRVARIFYGLQTTIANHPYAAFIEATGSGGNKRLTGAIIGNTQVLTSASGLQQAGNISSIYVTVGSTNIQAGVTFYHKSYAIHSGFNESSLANDLAIITIDGSFAGLTDVVPISFPTSEPTISSTNRTLCTMVGWGLYESYGNSLVLRQATYELFTHGECVSFGQSNASTVLCGRSLAGHACTGEDGAPLVCNGQLYGILTYQATCDMTKNSGLYQFAKVPVINLQGYLVIDAPQLTAPRKNYVSCP